MKRYRVHVVYRFMGWKYNHTGILYGVSLEHVYKKLACQWPHAQVTHIRELSDDENRLLDGGEYGSE